MASGAKVSSGAHIPVLVPTRYYASASDAASDATSGGKFSGRRFPLSAMADFAAAVGFDGIDLSLDSVDIHDESLPGVLYAFARRVESLGLCLPVCHLPFYMPAPDDVAAMRRFASEQVAALRMIASLRIPLAVIHPIVRHGSTASEAAWMFDNLTYLAPLREVAAARGITLALENMAGRPYPGHPDEAVFGSRAAHLMALAEKLDVAVCWDFGHAHLSGLKQSAELSVVAPRLRMVHIHDNDGIHDTHLIPGRGSIDWADAMAGLRAAGYASATRGGVTERCLDLELKTSHLPSDRALREEHAAYALREARHLAAML